MEYVLKLVANVFCILITFVSAKSYPFFNQAGNINIYSVILVASFHIYFLLASLVKVR